MSKVVISDPAKQDIQKAFEWWRDHRDAEQAGRWYRGIYAAIRTLQNNPGRYAHALETDLLPEGIHQLNFGIGRRPTHRILFTVAKGIVTVLRIRHTSQDVLTRDDID